MISEWQQRYSPLLLVLTSMPSDYCISQYTIIFQQLSLGEMYALVSLHTSKGMSACVL
jgi:hypothetical protein